MDKQNEGARRLLGWQIRGGFALLLQRSEVYLEDCAPAACASQRMVDGGRAAWAFGTLLSAALGICMEDHSTATCAPQRM